MIYTYRCQTCKKVFEKDIDINSKSVYRRLRLMGFPNLPICPKCGSSDVIKIILPTAVVFKGEDFTKSTKEK